MKKQQRVGIADIAKFCGVGTTTVSRVINNRGEVATATRQRVESAIAQLGYLPSTAAQCMAQGQPFKQPNSRIIAIVNLVKNSTTISHAEVVAALSRAAAKMGYRTVVTGPELNWDAEPFDGLLLLNDVNLKSEKPQVTVDWFSSDATIPGVLPDYAAGAFTAMDYALKQGYSKPLLLLTADSCSNNDKSFTSLLAHGFNWALCQHGMALTGRNWSTSIFTKEDAYAAVGALLKSSAAPDLIMTSDDAAIGIYRAARDAGKIIGQDLGIIGCDGISLIPYLQPTLATININIEQLAKEALQRLIAVMNSSPGPYPQQLLMETDFVCGGSLRKL